MSRGNSLYVALALARRQMTVLFKNPSLFLPPMLFPLMNFMAFAGGLSRLRHVPGFDFRSGYTAFTFVFVLLQSAAFGGVFAGFGIARDFEYGFARRLLVSAPKHRAGSSRIRVRGAHPLAASSPMVLTIVALIGGMQVGGNGIDFRAVRARADRQRRRAALGVRRRDAVPLGSVGAVDADADLPRCSSSRPCTFRSPCSGLDPRGGAAQPDHVHPHAGRGFISGEPIDVRCRLRDHARVLRRRSAVWALAGLSASAREARSSRGRYASRLAASSREHGRGREREARLVERGSRVVSRWSPRPGSKQHGAADALDEPPQLHRARERDGVTASGVPSAGGSGQKRSASHVTGSASAAKFVPQRGEKRVGRAPPSQVATRLAPRRRRSRGARRRAAGASGRGASTPRGRASRQTDRRPQRTGQEEEEERRDERGEEQRALAPARDARARGRAAPATGQAREAAGERESGDPRPAATASSPSRSEPSRPANAQKRSLTMTTPSGRAIPPSRGSAAAASARVEE